MSGMAIGGESALESELAMQLLVEYLTGELGDDADRASSSRVVAAIIAGNSLAPPTRSEDEDRPKRYGQEQPTFSSAPTLALDQLLSDLCSAMPVHLLARRARSSVGGHSSAAHPLCAAPARRPLRLAPPPHESAWLSLGNLKLLGTSGQNIDDIFKYVDEPDSARIDMALRTLEWGHLAPTAPDTLWCYPFKSTDPFVLKDRPDVLFVGNQPSYASAMYTFDPDADDKAQQGCRVVLVPEFAKPDRWCCSTSPRSTPNSSPSTCPCSSRALHMESNGDEQCLFGIS